MKILTKLLYNRLYKIKDDLDFYISENRVDIYNEIKNSICHAPNTCLEELKFKDDIEEYEEGYVGNLGDTAEIPIEAMYSCLPNATYTKAKSISLDEVLENKEETFSSMLLRLIDEKGLKDSVVYKRANIDRRLFSKIRGDVDYVPSKKTAIAFCLALKLNLEEAKMLLERAGYALSTSSRFDLIIMYLIENEEYNVHFANIVLDDYGEGTLSK